MHAVLLSSLLLTCAADDPAPLPTEWHGKWVGKLRFGDGDKAREVPLRLEVEPLKNGRVTWVAVYAKTATTREVRKDYELVAVSGKAGQFEIDEKNGVRIAARLTGDKKSLISLFRAGNQYIQTKYTRDGDTIRYELLSFTSEGALKTKPDGGRMEVESLKLTAVQSAELKRAK